MEQDLKFVLNNHANPKNLARIVVQTVRLRLKKALNE